MLSNSIVTLRGLDKFLLQSSSFGQHSVIVVVIIKYIVLGKAALA